jgi:hypothetical protein
MVYQYGLGIPNQRLGDIARERGVDEHMMADSTMSRMLQSTDSAAVTDSAKGAAAAKKPHTHPPGQEH